MENNHRETLETILENALHAYSQAEPLAGLEERILNRTLAVRVERRRACFRPLASAGLALLLCFCLFVLVRSRQLSGPKTSVLAVKQKPAMPNRPVPGLLVNSAPQLVAASRHRRSRRLVAKPEQLPIREPLTTEELALVRLVDRNPKEAAEAFTSFRGSDSPIGIQTLQITPLSADAESN